MCGFAGHYKTSAPFSRPELKAIGQRMADTLSHRGPDSHGVWQEKELALTLAHRRLAILDLSPDGHQPMHSDSGRYVIVFNGEIYNYLALQKDLEAAGYFFKGHSDTEVMLAAFEHWGVNQALQKLNGMFAIVLWDRQEKQLHFLRDRLGKKPLYIGWAGKSLVFASELKALHAHPEFSAPLNREAIALYTRYSYIPAPHSIYQQIWSLPAGMRLTLSAEHIKPGMDLSADMQPYWSHMAILQEARSAGISEQNEKRISEQFETLLGQCVRDRMISDVPLGAFLSGGIDSSSVVAVMQNQPGPSVKTFTIGFSEAGFDEAAYARNIARHLGTDHHELYINAQDALDVIPRLADIYDEPFGDVSAIPTYLLCRFAREHVTVALSGDGGDEMLGGYTRHVSGPDLWARLKYLPLPARRFMARLIARISIERWDRLRRSQPQFGTAMHKLAALMEEAGPEDIYRRLISHFTTPPLNAREPISPLTDPEFAAPDDLLFAEKMMYWDALSYLPNDILVKVDRASMACSLEARAPLLDKRIYEFVWRLPLDYKIRGGQGKYLLRRALGRHVPEAMFERPKQGFNMPVHDWLRGPLQEWAGDLLDERFLKAQNIFDVQKIRAIWDTHQCGEGHHAAQLWTILMFQAWYERWR